MDNLTYLKWQILKRRFEFANEYHIKALEAGMLPEVKEFEDMLDIATKELDAFEDAILKTRKHKGLQ